MNHLSIGEIKWRNVLEKGNRGVINLLYIVNNVIFVVSGSDVVIIRGWNAKHGYLTHQWSLQQNEYVLYIKSIKSSHSCVILSDFRSEEPQQVLWLAHEIILYRVVIKSNNIIDFTSFKIFNGEKLAEKTINAPVSVKDKYVFDYT